jgi:hypothetical protein
VKDPIETELTTLLDDEPDSTTELLLDFAELLDFGATLDEDDLATLLLDATELDDDFAELLLDFAELLDFGATLDEDDLATPLLDATELLDFTLLLDFGVMPEEDDLATPLLNAMELLDFTPLLDFGVMPEEEDDIFSADSPLTQRTEKPTSLRLTYSSALPLL